MATGPEPQPPLADLDAAIDALKVELLTARLERDLANGVIDAEEQEVLARFNLS